MKLTKKKKVRIVKAVLLAGAVAYNIADPRGELLDEEEALMKNRDKRKDLEKREALPTSKWRIPKEFLPGLLED